MRISKRAPRNRRTKVSREEKLSSNARLLLATVAAAIVAVSGALLYLSLEPGPMHLGTVLATIFGVGGTVVAAGVLMTLIYHSDRSGYDDRAGR